MAIKKSELYSSIWASCDELRSGMDASQYKDYVLFMLFIKYISDKYGNINTQVIQPLIDANTRLARGGFLDFNAPRPRRRVRALEMHRLRRTGDRYARDLWGRVGRVLAHPGSWNERPHSLPWRC